MTNHPRRRRTAPLFERLEVRSMMAGDTSTLGLMASPMGGDSVDACPSPVLSFPFDPTSPLIGVDPVALSPWLQYAATSTEGCIVVHVQADPVNGFQTDIAWFSLNPPPSPDSLPDFSNVDFTGVVFDGNDPTASPVPLDSLAPTTTVAGDPSVNAYVAIQSKSDFALFATMIGYTTIGLTNTPVPMTLPHATDGIVPNDQLQYSFVPQTSEDGTLPITTDGGVANDQVIGPVQYSSLPETGVDGSIPVLIDRLVATDPVIGPVQYSSIPQTSIDGPLPINTDGIVSTEQFIGPVQFSSAPQTSDDSAVLASAALVTSPPTAATTGSQAVTVTVATSATITGTPTTPTLPPPAAWAAYAAGRPIATRRTTPVAADVDGSLPKEVFAAL